MQKQARITSKGQITVPREVRRILGVRVGDPYYLKAMERVSASGLSAARARSRSIAVSEIWRSGLAAEVSVGGCAGSAGSADNDDRY